MKKYSLINNITGWIVFAIAAVTYLLTIEPTTSFWDCGEFITSAYKLEVGHPPGAPFFMILGRFFTLFASDATQVAYMVNVMSALVSAFTILFLYWSIAHIAKRIISKTGELDKGQLIAVIGTGIVGALVYTFSDSFWFSAVEGEVYATSSLFTAVVFWAILKWESEADQKYANRWLILIAYLMGLSIGIHLLNLLAIPAIVYIFYFKKYETSTKGIIWAGVISIVILLITIYGVVQGLFIIGSKFELLFVNFFKLPYYSGLFFYFLLLFGGLIFGIYHTFKHKKVLWNTIFTMFTVIIIGYSSFALILIRSKADTPMNQNKPDDVFSLLSYLNREQYGDRPLMMGQYFNAPLDETDPYPEVGNVYYEKLDNDSNEYYEVVDHKRVRNHISDYKTFFPRMYSDQDSPDHVTGYINWLNATKDDFYYPKINPETKEPIYDQYGDIVYDMYNPKRPPTFGENLNYFFKYQLNHMYFRYFMWNFAGKQNDIQGHGNVKDGNWISGIKFIDELRLGDQDHITTAMKDNKGNNKYFFFPLLLGILGMIFMLLPKFKGRGDKYFWVIMLFFFFTGIAIVLYLNQPPFQPRERDYAYAGSFYVFSMYIGFGVAFIYTFLKMFIPKVSAGLAATIISLFVPIIMLQQNWDDHDRSDRYTATDYAKNYLNSCEDNAIIFTNGDNDTFPLWYVQEVEGFRRDVRVINLSYFNTDWYIDQMRIKANDSPPVKFTSTPNNYEQGQREFLYTLDNPGLFVQDKYWANKSEYDSVYREIYNDHISYLATTNLTTVYTNDFETLKKGVNDIDPVQLRSFSVQLEEKTKEKILNISLDKLKDLNKELDSLLKKISEEPAPLMSVIKFVNNNSQEYQVQLQSGNWVNFFPTTYFSIPVNKKKVIENGTVQEVDKEAVVDAINWRFNVDHITKNQLMVLDMIATNDWDRPIYFASTVGGSHYLNLESYFQLEGLANRIVPVKATYRSFGLDGRVNSDILYDNIMNKFVWGGLETNPEKIYMDENNRRFVMNFKSSFKALAEQLVKEGKNEKAEKVLDKCYGLFTNEMSQFDYYDILIADSYLKINKKDKALNIIEITTQNFSEEFDYYYSLNDKHLMGMQNDVGRLTAVYKEAFMLLYNNGETELANSYAMPVFNKIEERYGFTTTLGSIQTELDYNKWISNLPTYQRGLLDLQMYLSQKINI